MLEQLAVGNTSIRLKPATSIYKGVFVHCDNELQTLEYSHGSSYKGVGLLRPVLLANNHHNSVGRREIVAFSTSKILTDYQHPRAQFLTTVSPEEVHFLMFDSSEFVILPRRPSRGETPGILRQFKQFDNSEHKVVARQWGLGGTPIRIVYSKHLNKALALYSVIDIIRSPQHGGIRRQVGKRTAKAVITSVDFDEEERRNSDPEAMDVEPAPTAQRQRYRQFLDCKPGERFLGMIEWFPRISALEYHLFVFNTLIKDRQKPSSGRILLFAVSSTENNDLNLVLKKTIDVTSPVYSVAPHWDRFSIVYCSGNDLNVLSLEPSPSGLKFGLPSKVNMRSPGRHLTMQEPYIYVSTANESFQTYTCYDRQLRHHSGDTVSRNGIYHLCVPGSDLLLATDMSGSITGLWQPPLSQANNAMVTVFDAALPQAITRLFAVKQSPSKRDVLLPGSAIILCEELSAYKYLGENSSPSELSPKISDYRSGALIGTSTDGTITQMLVMTAGWRLLKFIQNMCERHQSICPFRMAGGVRHLEPSSDHPKLMHINGDVLKRLLAKDAVKLLNEMLNRPIPTRDSDERFVDYETTETRWERFMEFAQELFGNDFCVQRGRQGVLIETLRWMTYVMRNAI